MAPDTRLPRRCSSAFLRADWSRLLAVTNRMYLGVGLRVFPSTGLNGTYGNSKPARRKRLFCVLTNRRLLGVFVKTVFRAFRRLDSMAVEWILDRCHMFVKRCLRLVTYRVANKIYSVPLAMVSSQTDSLAPALQLCIFRNQKLGNKSHPLRLALAECEMPATLQIQAGHALLRSRPTRDGGIPL